MAIFNPSPRGRGSHTPTRRNRVSVWEAPPVGAPRHIGGRIAARARLPQPKQTHWRERVGGPPVGAPPSARCSLETSTVAIFKPIAARARLPQPKQTHWRERVGAPLCGRPPVGAPPSARCSLETSTVAIFKPSPRGRGSHTRLPGCSACCGRESLSSPLPLGEGVGKGRPRHSRAFMKAHALTPGPSLWERGKKVRTQPAACTKR